MVKTSFIHILIHSFQFFQYYPDEKTKLYTLVTYPELEIDYYEFLKEFEMRPLPETITISITSKLKNELQQFCKDIEQSTIFELISPNQTDSSLPTLRSSTIVPSVSNTTIQFKPLRLDDEEELVPMYPCQMGESSSDYFYIAYGFNKGYTFIFKEFSPESGLKVYGLVEPTPYIDLTYSNLRRLEKYFLHVHRMYEPKAKDLDPICSLNGYQQFRLCSILENTRRFDISKEIDSTNKKINTERRHQKRCDENLKIIFENIDINSPAYVSLQVHITAMPCHMNKNRFSFLVSHNPSEEQSVFILNRSVNKTNGQKEGRVVQYVRNIALLKYANDLY